MFQQVRRKVVVGIGVTAIGVLAVACAGAPQLNSTVGGFQASVGGFSFQVPTTSIPFVSAATKPTTSATTTTTRDTLIGAVHSGEGCPLALPQ